MSILGWVRTTLQTALLSAAMAKTAGIDAAEQKSPHESYLANFPHFNPNYDFEAPGDVNTALKASLSQLGRFSFVQREFELYAWQLLIALNQPSNFHHTKSQYAPEARWAAWTTTEDLSNAAYDPNFESILCKRNARVEEFFKTADFSKERVLRSVSTLSNADIAEAKDFPSTFNTPLVDQHGNYVYYESILDPNQVEYLCNNHLLQRGVREEHARSSGISFPEGTEAVPWSGSFSLKLAWKILNVSKGDVPTRFVTSQAKVLDLSSDNRPIWRTVEVGLIGMHVVHKSRSAPERIWATFEQVDNLQTDVVAHPNIQPSFSNPLCPLCSSNRPSEPVTARQPTQVSRAIPIAMDTESLNREAQSALEIHGSPLRYYKLAGVQWPGVAGDATSATPTYIANAVMETFIQPRLESTPTPAMTDTSAKRRLDGESCISCHAHASARNGTPARSTLYDGRSDGDFSWFLSQRLP